MAERRRLPDQEARDLIEQRLDANLLVEAGAGSSKTESLARRMAAGIAGGVYGIEHMAAVTFTRKAAAELRGRFQIQLERRLAAETNPRRRERLETALARLERLFAGTIHAFCARLLRERPAEARIAPGFAELDEAADLEHQERAWHDYLDRARVTGSPLWQALVDADVAAEDLRPAFATVCMHDEVAFPAPAAPLPDPAPVWAALETFWTTLQARLPSPVAEETTCGIQQRALEFLGPWRVADRSRPAALAALLAHWENKPKVVQKWWGGPGERKAIALGAERLVDDFRTATVEPFLRAWRHHLYALVVQLLSEARRAAAEVRRRASALTYGDLLSRAAWLLRENTAVRAALGGKYRWLFVDEFQDTDPIQAEVLFLLAAAPGAERDWTRAALRPGALFIVGDPKQSIFRFRRADIDTYARVKERILATGGLVPELTASFRAVPALCRWANATFTRLLPARATPEQPAFHGLAPVRDGKDAPEAGVHQLVVTGATTRADVAACEAEAIARWIRHTVDRRRYAWGDIMILTRKKVLDGDDNVLSIYAHALETLHIPVEVSGDSAFVDSASVAALAGLLRALSDPDDAPAVVGVLRGPLFGLSDPELFRHRRAELGFLLTAPLPEDAAGPVVDALHALRAMYGWTRTLPAAAAIERILEETGILALGAATPAGAEAAHLLQAVDRARQVTEVGGTLADAARALEEDRGSAELESVPLEPGRHDVVRVMNLHKAKGLEARVVFLADPLGGVTPRANVHIVRDGEQATGSFRVTRRAGWKTIAIAEPEDWPAHEAAELAYVAAEEDRLLYVAATRAKDLLVVGRAAASGGSATRPWERFAPHLGEASQLRVPARAAAPAVAVGDLGAEARAAAQAARDAQRARVTTPSWTAESVTATAHRAGPANRPPEGRQTREPDTGLAWGALVHALLEHALRGPRDRAHLERLAGWLALGNPELQGVIPEALETVERVIVAEFWRRALASEERQAEVPFAVRLAADDGSVHVLHGVVDLAYRTTTGWELVDYKTDQLVAGLDRLVAQYAPQIQLYAAHWSRLVNQPVTPSLYFVRADAFRSAVATSPGGAS